MDAAETSNDGEEKDNDSTKKKLSLESIDSTLYRYRRKFLPRKPRIDHSNCDVLCLHAVGDNDDPHKTSESCKLPKTPKPSKQSTSRTTSKPIASTNKSMRSGKWITTYDGDKFLVVNDAFEDKILAFVTPEFLNLLCPVDKAKITSNLNTEST